MPNALRRFASGKRILISLILLLVLGTAYLLRPKGKEASEAGGPGGPGGKGRPVQVAVAKVRRDNLPITLEAIGNVEASESVSIQPQMTGMLQKVHFTQGQNVTRGQLLFEIDSRIQAANQAQMSAMLSRSQSGIREARANLTQANTQVAVVQANIRRDRAQLAFATQEVRRYKQLLDKKLTSVEEYERLRTNQSAAEATLAADQAALANARAQIQAGQAALQTAVSSSQADQSSLETARIQLGYSRIYSPITGKTGPLLINAGNAVQAHSSVLVNIKRLSPILVSFTVPEKQLAAFQQAMRRNGVAVTVKGEQLKPETGRLVFIDNTINKSNGTVILKARFENAANLLWPGQFVDVSAQLGLQQGALSIPAQAIQKGPNGDFVYIVRNQKAQVQPVVVDRIDRGTAVIAKGLSLDQEVIVTGHQALAPDAPVKIAGKGEGEGRQKGAGPREPDPTGPDTQTAAPASTRP